MEEGNFLKAWGGLSMHIFQQNHRVKLLGREQMSLQCLLSRKFLQFVLPVTWSHGKKYGITQNQLVSWWSEKPAELCGAKEQGIQPVHIRMQSLVGSFLFHYLKN
jgi:allantoinase